MRQALTVERFYPHPPAAVWRALTDPELLARWLMPNDIAPIVGHEFTFTTTPRPGFDGIVHCTVLAADVERRLVISWRSSSGLDTTVTWTLQADGAGTRLRLVHDGFDSSDPLQRQAFDTMGSGWRGHIGNRLAATLDAAAGLVARDQTGGCGSY